MDSYTPNFFHVNATFLKHGAVWSPKDQTQRFYNVYKIYQAIVLFLTLGLSSYSVVLGIIIHRKNFAILIEVLSVSFTIFLAAVKTSFWLIKGEKIKMIMNRLETDTFDCEKIDDFDPESMLKRAKRSGIKYACLLLFFSHLVLGLGYIPVMSLACWYYFNNLQISNVQTFKTLPYYTHIPVDHDTPLKYIFACLLQCVPMYLYVNAFVGVDSLFMNLMNFIATRMLILQGAFRTMRKRCLKKIIGNDLTPDNLHNSDEMEEYMMSDMKKCIQHLQLLLR